jgi:hypothetical protein
MTPHKAAMAAHATELFTTRVNNGRFIVDLPARAFSIHLLTSLRLERWLFLEEKATPLPDFCKEQNRNRCNCLITTLALWLLSLDENAQSLSLGLNPTCRKKFRPK